MPAIKAVRVRTSNVRQKSESVTAGGSEPFPGARMSRITFPPRELFDEDREHDAEHDREQGRRQVPSLQFPTVS